MEFVDIDHALKQLNSGAELTPGSEIDYDPGFIELENLLHASPEQQYGNTIIPASEPDWTKARSLGLTLLGKSLDFRVAIAVARSYTHREGLAGAVKGVQLVSSLVQHQWQHAHPSLEFDGEYDALPRSNAIALLGSEQGMLGDLRQSGLSLGQIGNITLGDIDKILNNATNDSSVSRDQMVQALSETLSSHHPELLQTQQLHSELEKLNSALLELLEPQDRPDLEDIIRFVAQLVPIAPVDAELGDAALDVDISDTEKTIHQVRAHRGVRNRTDAIAMLDIVCEYLEKHESANPAPHLIRRARNMIGQDFFTILKDIAPDGVSQAEHIIGLQQ